MLLARFPGATGEQLQKARAYAYGGCVIQDLGYYPFRQSGANTMRNDWISR